MAENRSTKLVSRIFRNLKRHGLFIDDILDEEIYDELTLVQDRIIARVNPDKKITITLKENIDEYPLTTDTVTNPALTTYKNNIASVKVIRQPDTFLYPFQILSNTEYAKLIDGEYINWFGIVSLCSGINFSSYIKTGIEMLGAKDGINKTFTIPDNIVENSEEIYLNGVLQVRDIDYSIVNSTITLLHEIIPTAEDTLVCNYIQYSAFGNAIVNTTQPLIGTIIGNRLEVYPVPDSGYDGKEIELIVYQKSGTGIIDSTTEPELGIEWDKAMELNTTEQFLEGDARIQYHNDFEREFDNNKSLIHRKRGTIQRASVYEGRHNESGWR